jgi:hypothetical protein
LFQIHACDLEPDGFPLLYIFFSIAVKVHFEFIPGPKKSPDGRFPESLATLIETNGKLSVDVDLFSFFCKRFGTLSIEVGKAHHATAGI